MPNRLNRAPAAQGVRRDVSSYFPGPAPCIPTTIWTGLFSVALVTLGAIGYLNGLGKTRRSLASLAVVLAFAITIWLIADLDRPQRGLIRVSQELMIELRDSMRAPAR